MSVGPGTRRSLIDTDTLRRAVLVLLGAVGAYAVAYAWLPGHLPLGVAALGLVIGSLNALVAMGLVLVYRSARIINFAQITIGGLGAAVATVAMVGWGLDYVASAVIGLVVAVASGLLVDAVVVRRLRDAPRLQLTVATAGVLLVFGAAETVLPDLTSHLGLTTGFVSPVTRSLAFTLGPVLFSGDATLAIVVVPLVLVALWWFLERTELGTTIRAAADGPERAVLLGIPVRRLSAAVWATAAGLSGIGAILAAPITHAQFVGIASGPADILPALAAAVMARFESLGRAFAWALAIGVLQEGVTWSYAESSKTDVALFLLVLVGLLVQHGSPGAARLRLSSMLRRARALVGAPGDGDGDDGEADGAPGAPGPRGPSERGSGVLSEWGGFEAIRSVHPVPSALARLPEVRAARLGILAVLVALAVGVPLALSAANLVLVTEIAIYVIVGVSLVVMTGWAGQISLGQFAFVGVGAATTAVLLVHAGADLFVALACSAAVGALVACLVGVPAFRLQGLSLAAATLAFAVPVSTFLLSSAHVPFLNPSTVGRPVLFDRFPLGFPASGRAFYLLCLAVLFVSLLVARNFRRTRAGRAAVAVRDNPRAASAFGISPLQARLAAFCLAGALAGVAGGLYTLSVYGTGSAGIDPDQSIWILAGVVVGGLGSLTGAVIGAAFVEAVQFYLPGAQSDLVLGLAVLVVLMVFPEGLAGLLYAGRDRLLAAVAARRGITLDPAGDDALGDGSAGSGLAVRGDPPAGRTAVIGLEDVDVHIDRARILAGVTFGVADNEVVALLGTNGAGKSTTLRTLAGVLHPTSGLDRADVRRLVLRALLGEGAVRRTWRGVLLDGADVAATGPAWRVRHGVVVVPGGRGVFPSLTVAENLRVAGWVARRRRDPARLEQATERVHALFPRLAERAHVRAGLLSGGEQQMLTIAQGLLCEPRVLLVDELSLGLAPTVVAQLIDALRQLVAEGMTVVIVEQSVNLATAVADRAVVMERGRIRFNGPTAELAARPELLRAVFLGHTAAALAGAPSTPAAAAGDGVRAPHTPGAAGPAGPAGPAVVAAAARPPVSARSGHGAALAAREVTKQFGGLGALSGVSFEVAPGEILGIIGSNGAGKTTLLDVCSGFRVPDGGRVSIGGLDVTALAPARRAALGLGRVFQDAALFPTMTVSETLATALEGQVPLRDPLLSVLWTRAIKESERLVASQVEVLLAAAGLEGHRDRLVSELSTGTRRVLELACALAHRPGVLLLDEPSSGVAQREAEALAPLLRTLRDQTGAAFVIVEHDVAFVSSVSDRMLCLHLGEVIAEGTPAAVLADPTVASAYLGADPVTIARSGPLVAAPA